MKITRTVYYYRYTKHDDDLLQYSDPFTMEEAARTEAQQLATQGYRGIIERHHQKKQDDEDDHGWLPDWNVPDNRAIELLDYF